MLSKICYNCFSTASAQFRGCFSSAGCGSAVEVMATSAEDCCINIDKGLYYSDGTTCQQCNSKSLLIVCTKHKHFH